jgi:hypothetical protein
VSQALLDNGVGLRKIFSQRFAWDVPDMSDMAHEQADKEERKKRRALPHLTRAMIVQDWIDIVFDAVSRATRGAIPFGVLIFAAVELANPDLISATHHISPELAQTLLGAALGALGMDIVGRGRRRI